jgi:hypothetical protein
MVERADDPRPRQIIGPLGEALSLSDLPPPDLRRWVMHRKAEVVAAVEGGLLSLEEACERYALSIEEFATWQRALEQFGMRALRATRTQEYKSVYRRKQCW